MERDVNQQVIAAIKRGEAARLRHLLQHADVDHIERWGDSLLHIAIRSRHMEIFKVLLAQNPRPHVNVRDAYGTTPVHEAVYYNLLECLEDLHDCGADINLANNTGNTPLHKAMIYGHEQCAQFLIRQKSNLQATNNDGNTPLHEAAKRNHVRCARLALEAGATVDAQNNFGNTPLHRCAFSGTMECAALLILEHGADVNKMNKCEETPLHRAAWKNREGCMMILLEHNANLDVQDETGNTPLHTAVNKGALECVRLLVKHGARCDIRNFAKQRPEDLTEDEIILQVLRGSTDSFLAIAERPMLPLQVGTYHVKMTHADFLGDGSYGTVHRAYKNTGQLMAAKKINTAKVYFSKCPDLKNQIPASEVIPNIKNLKHPNIIEVFHYKNEPERGDLWIIMEYCQFTLVSFLAKYRDTSAIDRFAILVQSANGVEYLHGKELAHRDLKNNNILIIPGGRWPRAKVSDFSYAKDLSLKESDCMSTVLGNPVWMAPELTDEHGHYCVDLQSKYTRAVDMYSLGLVFTYTCISHEGQAHWYHQQIKCGVEQNKNRSRDIVGDFFARYWHDGLADVQDLVRQMLCFYPESRLMTPSAGLSSLRPALCAAIQQWLQQGDKPTEKNSDVETSEETMLMKPVCAESQQSEDSEETPLKQPGGTNPAFVVDTDYSLHALDSSKK